MSLGRADLAATTNTVVYTVPLNKTASINVNICNRNSTAVRIRLALSAADTPVASEWLEYDYLLPGNQTIERTCVIANAGDRVVSYSTATNVSVNVYGFEE